MPRVQGVLDFLKQHTQEDSELAQWLIDHASNLAQAFDAVGSVYVEEAARILGRIRSAVDRADPDWAGKGTLSQKAIRAVRSTAGVSSVLVGMRRESYVEDVLQELRRPVIQSDRIESWKRLRQEALGKMQTETR